MSKNKKFLVLLLIIISSISLVSCGNDNKKKAGASGNEVGANEDSKNKETNADGEVISSRNDYKMGMPSEPTSMDPAKTKDLVTWIYVLQAYDTLVKFNWGTQEYEPGIATDWVINDDSTEVLFTIRDGVKFHNGDDMTLDDVIFSLNRALNSTYTSAISGSIEEFVPVGDNQVKLILKYGYSPILQVLVTPSFSIVNKKVVEEIEAKGEEYGRNAIGTGPYKLVEWRNGERLSFEAFEDYYMEPGRLKTVDVTIVPDQTSGALALENGTLDYFYGVQDADIIHLKEMDHLKVYEANDGVSLYDITFNVQDGIFADKKLRQAVAYAINREEMLIGGIEGNGEVTDTICPNGVFGYDPDYKWIQHDPEKAKELLAEAGYPNGLTVTFRQDASKTYMTSAEVMQAQLKEVGIDVIFDKLERATWTEQVGGNRDFEATLRMTTLVIYDVDYMLTRRFTSDMIGGANNYSGYSNPEFDKKVIEARIVNDPEERMTRYFELYDMIKEDVPFIPLYTDYSTPVVNAKIRGWIHHPNDRNEWRRLYFVE